jgi:hypothetical protein
VDTPESFDIPQLRAALLGLLGADARYYPEHIEQQFPRILANIVAQWGKRELDAYLDSLMVSDRPGRQGFSGEVAMEVFRLSTVHSGLGLSAEHSGTGWAGVEDAEMYRKALTKDNGNK